MRIASAARAGRDRSGGLRHRAVGHGPRSGLDGARGARRDAGRARLAADRGAAASRRSTIPISAPSPRVLRALVRAKAPGVDRVLLERLKSDDVMVRSTAARLLGEVKPAGAAPALVAAYAGRGGRSDVGRARSDPRRARSRCRRRRGQDARDAGARRSRLEHAAARRAPARSGSIPAPPPSPSARRRCGSTRAAYDALAAPPVSPHVVHRHQPRHDRDRAGGARRADDLRTTS